MIKHGLLDDKLQKEYEIKLVCAKPTPKKIHQPSLIREEYTVKKRQNKLFAFLGKVFSLLVCLALCAVFAFSLYMNATEDRAANGIPSIKVVKSDSMAQKNEKNTYLKTEGLHNQIQIFDIIVCHHLPAEDELELYDIVVYKQDDMYVVHRIVGIEEPNEKHPNERHFLLQGDAVDRPDKFPVLYSQMQGIYEGTRIPFLGSFVVFLQSPAGWLCILLVLFAMIATPIIEKKLLEETTDRLRYIQKGMYREACLRPNTAYRQGKKGGR